MYHKQARLNLVLRKVLIVGQRSISFRDFQALCTFLVARVWFCTLADPHYFIRKKRGDEEKGDEKALDGEADDGDVSDGHV